MAVVQFFFRHREIQTAIAGIALQLSFLFTQTPHTLPTGGLLNGRLDQGRAFWAASTICHWE